MFELCKYSVDIDVSFILLLYLTFLYYAFKLRGRYSPGAPFFGKKLTQKHKKRMKIEKEIYSTY